MQYSADDRRLQQMLRELGFNPQYIDGLRGELTDRAIGEYLASLPELSTLNIGSSTADLMPVLEQSYRGHMVSQVEDLSARIDVLSRNEIRQLQHALNALGMESGRVDGILGPITRSALDRYDTTFVTPSTEAAAEAEAAAAAQAAAEAEAAAAAQAAAEAEAAAAAQAAAEAEAAAAAQAAAEAEAAAAAQAAAEAEAAAAVITDDPPPLLPQGYAAELPNRELALELLAAGEPLPDLSTQQVHDVLLLSSLSNPTRDQVRSLQEGLNGLGLDAGTVDGVRGAKTRTAIADFQTQYAQQIEAVRESVIVETRALIADPTTLGAADNTARLALQDNLNFLGFHVGHADGIVGPTTRAQIDAFSREHEDPVITAARYEQIREVIAANFVSDTENLTEMEHNLEWLDYNPGEIDGVLDKQAFAALGAFASDHAPALLESTHDKIRTLLAKESLTSDEARELQQQLTILAFDVGAIDGNPDNTKTLCAVGQYLREHDQAKYSALITHTRELASIEQPTTDQVRELQRSLAMLGLQPGIIDGLSGRQTEGAATRFGLLDSNEPLPPSLIQTMQGNLIRLGLYEGLADGIVGNGTRQALSQFMEEHPYYSQFGISADNLSMGLNMALQIEAGTASPYEGPLMGSFISKTGTLTPFDAAAVADWRHFIGQNPGAVVRHSVPMGGDVVTVNSGHGARPWVAQSPYHEGADMIPGPDSNNTTVEASADGIVLYSGMMVNSHGGRNGYGYTVIIGHADGTQTSYSHMKPGLEVVPGQLVFRGQELGDMGGTGRNLFSYGAHLHYEQIDAEGNKRTPVIAGYLPLSSGVAGNGNHLNIHRATTYIAAGAIPPRGDVDTAHLSDAELSTLASVTTAELSRPTGPQI